jgi:hypothetical protein
VTKKKVSTLGEDARSKHFEYPIYDDKNSYSKAAFFRLSKKRLCLVLRSCILVKDDTEGESDDDLVKKCK